MIDDYPTLVFRVGEYEVIEGLTSGVAARLWAADPFIEYSQLESSVLLLQLLKYSE